MQKHVVTPESDEQVYPSVVVVITRADPLAPARQCDVSLLRHIGEGSIAIVVVEVASGLLVLRKALQSSSVDQEDVWPPVVVVVEERSTAAGSFDDVFLRTLAAILCPGCQSGASSDVNKMDIGRSRSRPRLGHGGQDCEQKASKDGSCD